MYHGRTKCVQAAVIHHGTTWNSLSYYNGEPLTEVYFVERAKHMSGLAHFSLRFLGVNAFDGDESLLYITYTM